jgi:EpsI family protein
VQRWGNIFEVNGHSLEVVRACSGVRSMMTLGTMAAAMAVILRFRVWAGISMLLLSLPIAMLGNAFRLVLTALLVLAFGDKMSEGWRHDAIGFLGFALSLGLLGLLTRLLHRPQAAGAATVAPVQTALVPRSIAWRRLWAGLQPLSSRSAAIALILLLAASVYGMLLGSHAPSPTSQSNLQSFPLQFMGLEGEEVGLSPRVLEEVGVDDYIFRNYWSAVSPEINLYVGYYRSQRQGSQIHSPQHCYPGTGWNVESSEPLRVRNHKGDIEELRRLVVRKKERTDVVVYWYDTRTGRLSGDFSLKFNLMRTALLHLPQDAAFVRWSTPIDETEDLDAATLRLLTAAARSLPQLDRSLPFGG